MNIDKRRYITLAFLAALVLTALARTDGQRKVTGLARQALMEQRERNSANSRMLSKTVGQQLTAFVRLQRQQADDVLSRYCCRILAQAGDICIVSIPLDRLEALAEEPAVMRIEAGRRTVTTLDTTLTIVNALPAYVTTDHHQAYTGEGVVVGLMDVGFDLSHPTFRDVSGTHFRVGAFWDQLSSDTVGSFLPVGRDYVGYDAVSNYGHSVDAKTQYHGNHTAGIAAGSGYTTPFRGLAYESDLCLVSNAISADTLYIDKADYYKYTSATDALGFKYIYDYADRQGKPCVVSFSEGYSPYIDEEDSLYAAFIDSLTSIPGHIFVASAGNEGLLRTYFEKPPGTIEAGAFLYSDNKSAVYKLKADGPITISLHAFDESSNVELSTLTLSSADGRLDSISSDTLIIGTEKCVVMAYRYPIAMSASADTCYYVMIRADRNLKFCKMAMVVGGTDSHVEVYGSVSHSFTSWSRRSEWDAAEYGHNILAPGCFPSTICVGATSHRESVINYKGVVRKMGISESGGLRAGYSSTGPAINGMMKPDVVAPGSVVVSSYSRYYLDETPDQDNDVVCLTDFCGKAHPWLQATGTSMSTPVVAGAIALWLEANPRLMQWEVKDILSRTCRYPDPTMIYPNNAYGYGEIDVYQGLLDVLGLNGIKGVSVNLLEDIRITPVSDGLQLMFDRLLPATLTVKIFRLDGSLVSKTCLPAPKTQVITLNVPLQQGNVYVVQIDSQDCRVDGSRLIRY